MPRDGKGARCPACRRLWNARGAERRRQRAKAHGRNTKAWQRLRAQALDRDGHRCRLCGSTRQPLTVHLDPSFHGRHDDAPLAALVTLCVRCHGSLDAPRAHRQFDPGGTGSPRAEIVAARPAPTTRPE
jgi:5-methylcytosine-specific restriction endonuclease McrA